MTDNNDRLSRIEALVESNSRAIQAMMEQRATDRLSHEERMAKIEALLERHDESIARLIRVEEGLSRMLASIDDDRPTILRRLMAIENKVDQILEHSQE